MTARQGQAELPPEPRRTWQEVPFAGLNPGDIFRLTAKVRPDALRHSQPYQYLGVEAGTILVVYPPLHQELHFTERRYYNIMIGHAEKLGLERVEGDPR